MCIYRLLINTFMRIQEFIDNIVTEGVFDPYNFKAIFMAGPPGAGKSTVRNDLFAGKGLKIVDPDYIHSLLQRKLREEEYSFNPQRDRAIRLRNQLINQGLGIILDGTNPDLTETAFIKQQLQERGYDTCMILVNAPLDICLDRIESRRQQTGRSVDNSYATSIHKRIQQNRQKYSIMFGSQFYEIENDKTQLDMGLAKRKILTWLNSPVDSLKPS